MWCGGGGGGGGSMPSSTDQEKIRPEPETLDAITSALPPTYLLSGFKNIGSIELTMAITVCVNWPD